jgi:hypothetical protein
MRQKSSIEIQHAQKSTELNGGLGIVGVLEMGHSLFQRLGTFRENLVIEEDEFGCSKDALRRVHEDPVSLK